MPAFRINSIQSSLKESTFSKDQRLDMPIARHVGCCSNRVTASSDKQVLPNFFKSRVASPASRYAYEIILVAPSSALMANGSKRAALCYYKLLLREQSISCAVIAMWGARI